MKMNIFQNNKTVKNKKWTYQQIHEETYQIISHCNWHQMTLVYSWMKKLIKKVKFSDFFYLS